MEWSSWRRTRLALGWIRPDAAAPVADESVASVVLLAVGAAVTSLAAGVTLVIALAALRHLHGSAGVPWGRAGGSSSCRSRRCSPSRSSIATAIGAGPAPPRHGTI